MNRKLRTDSRFIGPLIVPKLILPVLVLFGICLLPLGGIAATQGSECRQSINTTRDLGTASAPIPVLMSELQKNPEDYYGKTVSVHGELHRDMTDNVFTIEGDGFFRDKDVLVIGTVPKAEAAIPLEGGSLERGKEVSVTGVVQPFDRGKLECAYGPLHLDKYEGHSFTKNPVLIVDPTPPIARVEMPPFQFEKPLIDIPPVERSKPEPTIPEPAITEPTPEAAEPPQSLPRTAGQLPLLALAGLLALSGALVKFAR